MYIPFATIIYNFGLLYGLHMITKTLDKKKAFSLSVVGLSFFVGMDIMSAPYVVAQDGSYITSVDFWFVASDVAVAEVWKTLKVPSEYIHTMTYVLGTAILMLLIPAYLTTAKGLKRLN